MHTSGIPNISLLFNEVVDKDFFWISNRCSKAKLDWTTWLHIPSTIITQLIFLASYYFNIINRSKKQSYIIRTKGVKNRYGVTNP